MPGAGVCAQHFCAAVSRPPARRLQRNADEGEPVTESAEPALVCTGSGRCLPEGRTRAPRPPAQG